MPDQASLDPHAVIGAVRAQLRSRVVPLDAMPLLGAVQMALIDRMPLIPSTTSLAYALGFRSRWALTRALIAQGLPTASHLAAHTWACFMLLRHHASRSPLAAMALEDGMEPSVYYRRFRRAVGSSWSSWREATDLPLAFHSSPSSTVRSTTDPSVAPR